MDRRGPAAGKGNRPSVEQAKMVAQVDSNSRIQIMVTTDTRRSVERKTDWDGLGEKMEGKSMRRMATISVCSLLLTAGLAWGQETSVDSMPPSVVKTVPQSGDTSVDATVTKQITVTFSKEMMDGSWSWATMSKETAPEIVGKPRYLDDKRTCVAEVKLEPKKTYVLWLNSKKFGNFKDAEGNAAVPYLLVFQTK
jgi:RNA polymerase sigma-70 factor (ECF subfamily)